MILPPFELHRPRTLDEALALRLGRGTRWLAGGTQLLVAMKHGEESPPDLIDLKRVPDLAGITATEGGVRIGAGATYHAIRHHPDVRAACPALVDLIARIGNPRVRAAGTLGGSLGYADPRWDPMTLLLAVGADVGLASAGRARRVPVADLAGTRESDELITDVGVPATPAGTYLKFHTAGRMTLGLALAGPVAGGAFTAPPGVVVGAAVPAPAACTEAAALLADRPLDPRDAGVRRAAEAAAEEVEPLSDAFASAGYKRRLVRALLPRAVARLALLEAA
jgi:aerobic carbon-monoxide dehydrogenase medium subunit